MACLLAAGISNIFMDNRRKNNMAFLIGDRTHLRVSQGAELRWCPRWHEAIPRKVDDAKGKESA
jgi:hypothetical protein